MNFDRERIMSVTNFRYVASLGLCLLATSAFAETPGGIQDSFAQAARASSPTFSGFSTSRGERLFQSTHGGEWSCASCHTRDPRDVGAHARTGKTIKALAPGSNPQRFTSSSKVEKWFKRNCNDVLGRECTAQEKGDVLTYLMSLGK